MPAEAEVRPVPKRARAPGTPPLPELLAPQVDRFDLQLPLAIRGGLVPPVAETPGSPAFSKRPLHRSSARMVRHRRAPIAAARILA